MEEQDYLAEPMAYDAERLKLARRRKIAEALIATEAPGMVGNGNGIYAMSGPLGGVGAALSRGVGKYEMNLADELETRLGQRERADQAKLLSSIPASGPERQQAQYNAALRMPSLRGMIEHQLSADARSQDRAAERTWRTEQAEANRIESGEQKAADRVAREENILTRAQTPNVNVSVAAPRDAEMVELKKDMLRAQIQGAMDKHGKPDPKATQANKDAADVERLAAQAAPLIGVATGSGAGAVYDKALALIGKSSESADAAAQLASLGGFLVSKMPKMSGPQSDKDVQLYKEMAGRLGDPSVPPSQKRAALDTILRYHQQAAPAQPANSAVAAGTRGMHKGKPVVMGADGEWEYAK